MIIIIILCVLLFSCTNNENGIPPTTEDKTDGDISFGNNGSQRELFSGLLRTGEFFTAEQIEELKTQALSRQSVQTGIGGFADIVAIEPSDGSDQQVFISVDNKITYEKTQIQPPDGAQARIIIASSGGGSGEIYIG
jgi:hypothetical protein